MLTSELIKYLQTEVGQRPLLSSSDCCKDFQATAERDATASRSRDGHNDPIRRLNLRLLGSLGLWRSRYTFRRWRSENSKVRNCSAPRWMMTANTNHPNVLAELNRVNDTKGITTKLPGNLEKGGKAPKLHVIRESLEFPDRCLNLRDEPCASI